ncbi:MAG TPA: hypothetical protein ENK48_07390 [Gammaproteobacteria bacterium]|nr:hypothetical protein [Gammaproteobacteria bacterium]
MGGGTGRRRLLLCLSFTEGAAVMIAEIAGAKMLTPVYGSALYVWGTVLGVTLAALTTGYYVGGLLSHRPGRRLILYWCLAGAGLMIAFMPSLARGLMFTFEDMGPVPAVLILSCLYLLPPLLLLGATSPLIIGLISGQVRDAGAAAGTVYAISTLGGILATFLTGFFFIPEYGLSRTALATGLLLAVLPTLCLLSRRQTSAILVPIVLLLLMTPDDRRQRSDIRVLHMSEGLLGQLLVADIPLVNRQTGQRRMDRMLFVNRMGQTWVDLASGRSRMRSITHIRALSRLLPRGSRILLIGLGGGVLARDLLADGHQVESVELDERIVEVAHRYFGLPTDSVVHVDDGRHFLRTARGPYDMVILDVFKGEVQPAHLLTVETFREIRALLRPRGMLAINFNAFLRGERGLSGRSLLKTLETADFRVAILPTHEGEEGNNIYVGTLVDLGLKESRLPVRGRPLGALLLDTAAIDRGDALVFTDDHPLLEKLNQEATAVWRAGYRRYAKQFLARGVPLFN